VKTVRIAIGVILLILGIAVLNSCTPTPIVTILWEDDGNGFIQFQTNDPDNENQAFMKLYPSTIENPLVLLEVTVKKVSGAAGAGYGIAFCAFDDQNYYMVLINIGGEYRIAKVVFGNLYNLTTDWITSSHLITDYNSVNTLRITKLGIRYTLNINGADENFFDDTSFTGGQSGFVVYVATKGLEYFPAGVVDVHFQMTSPINIP